MLQMLQDRQLTISELFIMSVEVTKKNFKSILLISLLFFTPALVVLGLIAGKAFSVLDIVNGSLLTGSMVNGQTLGQLWIYIIVMLLVSILVVPIGEVAISMVIKNSLYDEKVSAGKVLLHAFEKGPAIVFAGVVYLICVGVGSLLIFPGIYMAILWYFYTIAIAVDDKGAMESFFRSQELVKGQWWATFGIVALTSLIMELINYAISILLFQAGETVITNFIYSFISFGMSIFMLIFFTLVYFNRKFKIEPCQKPPVQNEEE